MIEKCAIITPMEKKDENFVISSWLKSMHESPQFSGCRNTVYYGLSPKVENCLLENKVLVARSKDDYDQIVGWICYREHSGCLLVEWAYVKFSFRRVGVLKWLVKTAQKDCAGSEILYTIKPTNSRVARALNAEYFPLEQMKGES